MPAALHPSTLAVLACRVLQLTVTLLDASSAPLASADLAQVMIDFGSSAVLAFVAADGNTTAPDGHQVATGVWIGDGQYQVRHIQRTSQVHAQTGLVIC
jgi:hypothetical protein